MSTVDTFSVAHLGRLRSVPLGVEPQRDNLTRAHLGWLALFDGSELVTDDSFCVVLRDDDTFAVATASDASFCVTLQSDEAFRVVTSDDGSFCVVLIDSDEVMI